MTDNKKNHLPIHLRTNVELLNREEKMRRLKSDLLYESMKNE